MGLFSRTAALTREWAQGRKPDRFIVVRVAKVAPDDGGLFGIGKSPSIAGSHPDPYKIEGTILAGPAQDGTKHVTMIVPGSEGKTLAGGDRLAFGLLGKNACICVAKAPPEVADAALEKWAQGIECKP